jgi:choline dehydrogenase-like flavoprotein
VEARGAFAPTADTLRREGLLNCAISLRPAHETDAAFTDPRVRAALESWEMLRSRAAPDYPWRKARRALTAPQLLASAVWKRAFARPEPGSPRPLLCLFETAPDPENRVTLGNTCDALGRRVARLRWKLGELEKRSVSRAYELLNADLRAAGAGRLASRGNPAREAGSYKGSVGEHHLGTTRMHRDPRQGVADENARVHGLDNLFVAGGSAFTTAGFANPTLTVVALAARLAGHLRSNAKLWDQPIQPRASRQ